MRLTDDQIEQYSRQIILRELGGTGQRRLLASSCAIVGRGAAFDTIVTYLAGAGVGRLALPSQTAQTLAFAEPAQRNSDVVVESVTLVPSDYDVWIDAGADASAHPTAGRARLGEIRVSEVSHGVELDLIPPASGCLTCHPEGPKGTSQVAELAPAGALAALAALRWLAEIAPDPTPRRLRLTSGAPSWTEETLRPTPKCSRPCRT